MNDSEVENLTDLFNSGISLEENSDLTEIETMANPNYQLLKLYIDTIPQYEGNPHTLNIFLDNCEILISQFFDATNQQLNSFLLRALMSKLIGRALMLIGSRTELRTWPEIKQALQLSFGDQRNIDCLVQDLIVLRPLKNETPYNFGMRCQETRSLVISKLNASNDTVTEKTIKIRNYNDLALKTFIRGLTGQLQNNIRLRNPDSLEVAMSLVIEEENFMYSQNRSNTLNNQSYTHIPRMAPARQTTHHPNFSQNNNANYRNFQSPHLQTPISNNRSSQPGFVNNQFRPPIPSFQPRQGFNNFNRPFNQNPQTQWRPNNNFSTQRQPFSNQPRQSQIFRGSSNQSRNQSNPNKPYKPTPMDTSSGNTRLAPQRNFISTELFAHDVNNQNYEFDDPSENQIQPKTSYQTHDFQNSEYFDPHDTNQTYPECDDSDQYQSDDLNQISQNQNANFQQEASYDNLT